MTLIQVNISFIGSENPLNTNENSLKISLSAVKFRSHYREVPRNFAELTQIAAKYHCLQDSRNIVEKSLQTKLHEL